MNRAIIFLLPTCQRTFLFCCHL